VDLDHLVATLEIGRPRSRAFTGRLQKWYLRLKPQVQPDSYANSFVAGFTINYVLLARRVSCRRDGATPA
jgi:hypothetical protein